MAQYVKQASLLGRIGSGIGKGLADQVPKEVDRYRLKQGLQELSEKKGLSPFQQFAELSSIPGVTPQMIESGSKLLRYQGSRDAYRQNSGQGMPEQAQGPSIRDVQFGNMPSSSPQAQGNPQEQEEMGQPQIVNQNPVSDKFLPGIPWNQQQRDADISRVWESHPEFTFEEAMAQSADNEKRYLAQPEAYQRQLAYLEDQQGKVNSEIDSQLMNKLQKPKIEDVWSELTGESKNRIQRGVARDLAMNPNSTVRDEVNKWTDKALTNAKAKTALDELAQRDFSDKLFKKEQTLSKLKGASPIFRDFGNSEEYENILRSKFDLSPQGAASIAYLPTKSNQDYLQTVKPSVPRDYYQNSIKHAANVLNGNVLTGNDSILALAKNIKERDPFFDQKAFFNYLREHQDESTLSPKQKRDLIKGASDIFPNWGDLWIFPKLGRG